MNATTTPDRPISRREIRLQMEADRAREAKLRPLIEATAKRLNMECLAIGDEQAAFAKLEGDQTFEIYLYSIDDTYLARGAFTPGRCIAKLQRQDMEEEAFEALAKRLVS